MKGGAVIAWSIGGAVAFVGLVAAIAKRKLDQAEVSGGEVELTTADLFPVSVTPVTSEKSPYVLVGLHQTPTGATSLSQADIIQAVRDGKLEYHWTDLPGFDGVQVFEDAGRIDGLRVPVTARTTAAIVDILSSSLGATISPTTPLVEDLMYNDANTRVRPMPQQVDSPNSVALFSLSLDKQIAKQTSGRPGWGLVSCVGKSWVISNLALDHPGKAVNYGMHWPASAATTGSGPWPSVDNKSKVFQQPSTMHNADHSDYSQTLRLCKLATGAQLPSHETLRATRLWYEQA